MPINLPERRHFNEGGYDIDEVLAWNACIDEVKRLNPDVPWDASQIKQPGWHHVEAAFIEGAREARANPEASEGLFRRAADGYTKRVFEEVDPMSETALRTGSWNGWSEVGDPVGVMVVQGSNEPRPPCTICGVPYEKHGSYPTCATHPYTPGAQVNQQGGTHGTTTV